MKDGINNRGIFSTTTTSTTTTTTTTTATNTQQTSNDFYNVIGNWIKSKVKVNDLFPWSQMRNVKWMNQRATPGHAYIPTEVVKFYILSESVFIYNFKLKINFIFT